MTSPVVAVRIPEIRVPGKPLGRHIVHDRRSRNYELPQAEVGAEITDVEHASVGLPLNQGQVGKCTAEALAGAQNTEPNWDAHLAAQGYGEQRTADTPYNDNDTDVLYSKETADEGMPWPAYDPGGSGLAVCKAALELGWISRYWHCFQFERALRGLMVRPVMFGLNWYNTMDEPDGDGIVDIGPGAFVRGGHEIMAYKISASEQLVWFWQSWGLGFGIGGKFAMGYGTLERLLAEQGDCTVPVP